MAAASTLRTRSGRGKDSNTMTMEQLQARIAELEKSVPQRPAVAKKLPTGKPFMFDGTRDDQKIFTWLSRIKTQHKVSAIASGTVLTEEEKIIVAISYLDDIPCRLYDVKVAKDGEFETYDAFEEWMRKNYVPQDMLAKYRDEYRDIRQRDGESVERYQLRFTELVSKLDKHVDESFQVSDFVHGLRRPYRERLDRHDDLSTYDNGITVEEVVKRINRSVRLSADTSYNGKASEKKPTNSNSGNKPFERRVAPNSKVQFKSGGGNKNTLSAEQKMKLEKFIIAKGGRFVELNVVHNKE
jgi:Retrotransposon gag protein